MRHFIALLGVAAALVCSFPAPVLAQVTSGGGWPLVGGGEPSPQSFDATMGDPGDPTRNRGMVGGGGFYDARVTVAPRYEAPGDGKLYVALDGKRVTKEVVAQNDPGGLAYLGWAFALMDMDSPADRVTHVTANFDTGAAVSPLPSSNPLVFPIPAGARNLQSIVVDWQWRDNHETLTFAAGLERNHYLVLGLMAALGGTAMLRKKRWVAVRLVDTTGKPVPHEPFQVRYPNGVTVDGKLDPWGFALVYSYAPTLREGALAEALDAVVRGAVSSLPQPEITFPNLDAREWGASGTESLDEAGRTLQKGPPHDGR